MSAGKKLTRLEIDVRKLQNIINDLVQENHQLKTLLTQYTQASIPKNPNAC